MYRVNRIKIDTFIVENRRSQEEGSDEMQFQTRLKNMRQNYFPPQILPPCFCTLFSAFLCTPFSINNEFSLFSQTIHNIFQVWRKTLVCFLQFSSTNVYDERKLYKINKKKRIIKRNISTPCYIYIYTFFVCNHCLMTSDRSNKLPNWTQFLIQSS